MQNESLRLSILSWPLPSFVYWGRVENECTSQVNDPTWTISKFFSCCLSSAQPSWFPIKSLWTQERSLACRCGASRTWTWSWFPRPCTATSSLETPTCCSTPPRRPLTTFTCGWVCCERKKEKDLLTWPLCALFTTLSSPGFKKTKGCSLFFFWNPVVLQRNIALHLFFVVKIKYEIQGTWLQDGTCTAKPNGSGDFQKATPCVDPNVMAHCEIPRRPSRSVLSSNKSMGFFLRAALMHRAVQNGHETHRDKHFKPAQTWHGDDRRNVHVALDRSKNNWRSFQSFKN